MFLLCVTSICPGQCKKYSNNKYFNVYYCYFIIIISLKACNDYITSLVLASEKHLVGKAMAMIEFNFCKRCTKTLKM